MVKLVLDADGAIKLARAGVLKHLAGFAKCFMPKQTYQEVLRGKEKMYDDAFIIEELAENKEINVIDVKAEERIGLGPGESAAFVLFQKLKADAIVSDDRKFLAFLEEEEIAFLTPTHAIVLLAVKKVLSKGDSLAALDKIRSLVREQNYHDAKEMIGGE